MRIQGFRGNCSTLAGKSRGGTPFCRTGKTVFPKKDLFFGNFLPTHTQLVFLRAAFRINRFPHKTFLHSLKAPCNLIGFVV